MKASFYRRPVVEVAQALIGCVVSCGECSGMIVETEAYHDSEPACHAFIGRTPRTETLFGPPGIAYVYLSYGVHALLNAVCEPEGVGAAVLIRAIEPLTGVELMAARRGLSPRCPRALCSGPGKLTQALGVTLADNGTDLSDGRIVISGRGRRLGDPVVQRDRRIGISKARELPWRFCLAGSEYLSVTVPRH
ncbi:MAG: DNA-3-methyladenine glycosylase [Actinomycetota bacterium]|nr:DNA-3-methyladenine glycosylase [Actinomycetota bacterium]